MGHRSGRPRRVPPGPGSQHVRLDRRPGRGVRGARRVRRRGRQLRRHRRLLHGRVPATPAASPRRSSASGSRPAAAATTSSSRRRSARCPAAPGSRRANIAAAVDDSLRRLQTDRIDLYWAHKDDPDTPQEETLAAFDGLVRAGKVRAIGASNFSADAAAQSALAISAREGLAAYVALQPHYNLMERAEFEATLLPVLSRAGLSCVPYYGLARGFLTGKYRPGRRRSTAPAPRAPAPTSTTAGSRCSPCWTRWRRRTASPVAAVALAWLAAQPTVAAPIASARTADQLAELLPDARPRADRRARCAALSAASRL